MPCWGFNRLHLWICLTPLQRSLQRVITCSTWQSLFSSRQEFMTGNLGGSICLIKVSKFSEFNLFVSSHALLPHYTHFLSYYRLVAYNSVVCYTHLRVSLIRAFACSDVQCARFTHVVCWNCTQNSTILWKGHASEHILNN